MQTVSCPSCGAEVKFRSHASVMAVCEYCNTSVLKDVDAVQDLGRMSSVLEDYSPIQIGASGVFGGRQFSVVGRIQLRYAAGVWNEWYLLFDDGQTAWLGDSSGLYTITTARDAGGPLPSFDALEPGRMESIGAERFMTSELRTAQCVGGQGELPFKVGEGWQAKVADFRRGASFVTLDYSDGPAPAVYNGLSVTLDGLKFQLLRDEDQIQRSAGRYRGKLSALDCPACGGPIKYLPGMTANLLCPACRTRIDAAGPEARVLAAGEKAAAVPTSLELGAVASLNKQEYRVIGFMVRRDDEGARWTEYLLHGARSGFSWLVETEEGWFRANVMEEWPDWHWTGADTATFDKVAYEKLYDYRATVVHAAGAFNWRVAVGDSARVYEFKHNQVRLSAELTGEELTWSRSTPIPTDQVKAWFGAAFHGELSPATPKEVWVKGRYGIMAKKFIMIMLVLNAIPVLFAFRSAFVPTLLGALAVYLPALFLDFTDKDDT
ncbi:DUF4178 domain-containing protein [Pseudoduganella namucuonensis]|uniref:DUF4178 domain-containing protein n=1 Tax=Pseudoduganella namucuonensis TaxID=1035707 RepID=A0A1I7G943_9BURK|nr:DUF4178 domain-containing protein [Pseudoduganella namucuonensis]SFU44964.1 protein of unknown function [Pseudoduganella namucuonensis]